MNDFPVKYDKNQIDDMYEKLNKSLSGDRIDLLKRYFEAMNNFYKLIPLKRMLRILNEHYEENYSEEDFLEFSEIVRHEMHYYYILGKEELFDNVPASNPIERELVHETLIDFGDEYDELAEAKKYKPYYVMPKDELLKYEDDFYIAMTPECLAMSDFIQQYITNDPTRIKDHLYRIFFTIICDDSSPQHALDFMGKFQNIIKLSDKQFNVFSRLYIDLHNNTRNPQLNGFTPSEYFKKSNDKFESMYLDSSDILNDNSANYGNLQKPIRIKKIGPNEPCPCGSGKKYKKCCGISS